MATLNIVAGHSGTFVKVSPTEIWKVRARAPRPSRRALCPPASPRGAQLTDKPERQMLRTLMASPELKSLVPAYLKDVPLDQWPASAAQQPGEDSACLELQDLTAGFECPCVMDVKIGTRTFLEDEVSNPKVRADLLAKMDKLDSGAATAAERASVSTAPSAPLARPLAPPPARCGLRARPPRANPRRRCSPDAGRHHEDAVHAIPRVPIDLIEPRIPARRLPRQLARRHVRARVRGGQGGAEPSPNRGGAKTRLPSPPPRRQSRAACPRAIPLTRRISLRVRRACSPTCAPSPPVTQRSERSISRG